MQIDVAKALLGLQDSELNESQINSAYWAAMQMNHPDRYIDNEQLRKHAEEQCRLINEARKTLLAYSAKEEMPFRIDFSDDIDIQGDYGVQVNSVRPADYPEAASIPSPSTGRKAYKSISWGQYKNYIIGACVAILVVAAWFIPAEIPVPSRTINDMRDEGEIVRITYLGITDDLSSFQVAADPEDFNITADVALPSSVAPDTKGYIGTLHGQLELDGSYEYSYDFLFPREGNLLQSLLTRFGVWNFNYPIEGHVEGISDVVYENQEEGFVAAFPKTPTEKSLSETLPSFGEVTGASFFAGKDSRFTTVDIINLGPITETLGAASEEQKRAIMASNLRTDLMRFSDIVEPASSQYNPTYSTIDGYTCATTIDPFIYREDAGGDGSTLYCYAMSVITEDKMYELAGARSSYEEAKQALDSFSLL